MLFQSMSSIWFALSLPVILLMYLLKRTYIDTPVSSSLLWRKVLREQEANRPWQKLRRQLLLLLQLAAAALLVLALMDPVAAGRAAGGRHVVIVLDASASMTSADGERTRLETAVQSLHQWLEEEPAASQITLITTGDEPTIAASGNPKAVIEALGDVRPNFGQNDAAAALTLADASLRSVANGEIVFVTDGLSAGLDALRLANPLRQMKVGGGNDNVAIAAFGVRGGRAEGERATAVATLLNQGERSVSGTFAIETAESEQRLYAVDFRLAPGEQRVIYTEVDALEAEEAAYYRAAIYAGSADGYAADDTAYAFPSATGEKRRVLLVSSGNLFLDKALQLAGIQTIQANPDTFEPNDELLNEIDWIVIDAEIQADKLASDAWRSLMAAKPVWRIWSADSPPPGQSSALPNVAAPVVQDHPVVRYLTFEDVHIAKFAKTDAETELGDPVVTYGGVPAIYAGRSNGKPAIVLAFDLRDSDFPMRPEFPIFVSQAADWMSGGIAANLGQAVAGSRIEIQHQAAAVQSVWEPVEVPESVKYSIFEMNGEIDKQGALGGEQLVPGVPGLYRYMEYDGNGQSLGSRLLAVVVDPAEGRMVGNGNDADSVSQDGLGERQGDSFDSAAEAAQSDVLTEEAASAVWPLAPWLAVLLFALIVVEWGVYRRGTAVR